MSTCRYFETKCCQSCSLLGLGPEGSARQKESSFFNQARQNLGSNLPLEALFIPTKFFASRGKAKLTVSGDVSAPIIGILDEKLQGVELLNCPLHLPEINKLLKLLPNFISREQLYPYDIEKRRGELKGLIIVANHNASEIILRFVLRSRNLLPRLKQALPQLQQDFPALKVLSANIQPIPHAILEGSEEILLSEQSTIEERYNSFIIKLAPQSFVQVTHETAVALYQHFAELVSHYAISSLLELYAGVGAFSFAAAAKLRWGVAVEISARAVECARLAAEQNAFPQLSFHAATAESFLASHKLPEKPEAVLVNPPRRGLSNQVITALQRLAPPYLFYSSCNPQTLFADLKYFLIDYSLLELKPFDMFPLTEHLEVFAVLKRHS